MFGIIGNPLGHSFSPAYFQAKFSALGLPFTYQKFELQSVAELPELLKQHPELRGLNVTIPFKRSVLPYLDTISAEAEAIGAVNCIRIENGRLAGFNTDVTGFASSLHDFIGTESALKALVLGTGGSSKAVCYVLRGLQVPHLSVSRGADAKNPAVIPYEELTPDLLREHRLIINTTPLGMWPEVQQRPVIPYEALTAGHYLFDLIYHPTETWFLRSGKERGAATQNGLPMLHAQAEAAWTIWMDSVLPAG